VKVHADKVNGKSKGYGYVEFTQSELDGAIAAKQKLHLHGHVLNDCRISVAFASPERMKGAEYTNTPVHIPRQKLHHGGGGMRHANVNPHTNAHMAQASLFPKIGRFAGPATVIPTAAVLNTSSLASTAAINPMAARTGGAAQGTNGVVKREAGSTANGQSAATTNVKTENGAGMQSSI
jgi:hypothetical protein